MDNFIRLVALISLFIPVPQVSVDSLNVEYSEKSSQAVSKPRKELNLVNRLPTKQKQSDTPQKASGGSIRAKVYAAGGAALVELLTHESGLDPNAVNPTSGACGLFQRLPCTVTLGDVDGQIKDGMRYINGRYGSSEAALAHWKANNWY